MYPLKSQVLIRFTTCTDSLSGVICSTCKLSVSLQLSLGLIVRDDINKILVSESQSRVKYVRTYVEVYPDPIARYICIILVDQHGSQLSRVESDFSRICFQENTTILSFQPHEYPSLGLFNFKVTKYLSSPITFSSFI